MKASHSAEPGTALVTTNFLALHAAAQASIDAVTALDEKFGKLHPQIVLYIEMLALDCEHSSDGEWVKLRREKDGVAHFFMLYSNEQYFRMFGVRPKHYVGEEDDVHWGDDQHFNEADEYVWSTGLHSNVIEKATNPGSGLKQDLLVHKFPVDLEAAGVRLIRGRCGWLKPDGATDTRGQIAA